MVGFLVVVGFVRFWPDPLPCYVPFRHMVVPIQAACVGASARQTASHGALRRRLGRYRRTSKATSRCLPPARASWPAEEVRPALTLVPVSRSSLRQPPSPAVAEVLVMHSPGGWRLDIPATLPLPVLSQLLRALS